MVPDIIAQGPMIRLLQNESVTVSLYEDEYSRRVRVDDYSGPLEDIKSAVDAALPSWTEKLIVKSRPGDVAFFESKGLRREAFIGGYFAGTDMHFLARYLTLERSHSPREADVLLVPPATSPAPPANVRFAGPDDAEDLARLYREAFRIYPTPVYDPVHVRKTMEDGTVYAVVREGQKIISAASAEINAKYHNAELTDCATAEGHEGAAASAGGRSENPRHHLLLHHCAVSFIRHEQSISPVGIHVWWPHDEELHDLLGDGGYECVV
jgi:beta-lysine N6-acetyltransferase